MIIELIIKLFFSYPESNKLNNDLLKQHISKALEKVGQGRTDKNGYPIEIDFNELPMLVHMRLSFFIFLCTLPLKFRSAVPGPRTPFFVCGLEDGTR